MTYPESNQLDQYEIQPIDPAKIFELNEIERSPSLVRKFVELLLYTTIVVSNFPALTFLVDIPYALGGLLFTSGFLAFVLMLADGQKISTVVWCAIIMNIAANLSQVLGQGAIPVIGAGLTLFSHWLSRLIMICYLVQNKATNYRVLLFFATLVVLTVWSGGVITDTTSRLALSEIEAGGGFSNANTLAYLTGLFSVAVLFWSLRASKLIRPFLWALAAALIYILIRTVSRGGMLAFACGIMVLLFSILMGRGTRIGGIVLIVISIFVFFQFSYLVADSFEFLGERMGQESSRVDVYSMSTVNAIFDSIILGGGPRTKTSAGFSAHNAFIYTHMCYGGITIWPYIILLWIFGVRMLRMFRADDLDFTIKFTVIALFGMSLGSVILSNVAYVYLSSVYALAVVEKYTAPYSKRRIAEREAYLTDDLPAQENYQVE